MSSLNINYIEKNSIEELKELLKIDKFTWPQIFISKNNSQTLIGGWNDFYKYTKGTFDYDKLYEVAYTATINLNNVIDVNYYPVPQTKLSNMKHRPIGLGIQGLADAIVLLKIPYDSEECLEFNAKVMETIYLASMTASNDLSILRYELMSKLINYKFDYPEFYDSKLNLDDIQMNEYYHILKPNKYELCKDPNSTTLGAYSSFDGSLFSQGKFQFDLWSVQPFYKERWDNLRLDVIKYGTRNSLLTSLMPTASTSQILGNNECFEFFTNNIYTRNTQAGDFVMVNKYLVNDLIKIGLWNTELKDKIIGDNGSIQNLDIPNVYKELYKTIWEIKQIWVLKGAVARGPFVDQTQSMNIFMAEPDYQRLGSSHFWAWKNGLKTGIYYLRTKPATDAIKFTIDPSLLKNDEGCTNCSA
jgi:ribonucleoside-diphosphate reductase alpha chain